MSTVELVEIIQELNLAKILGSQMQHHEDPCYHVHIPEVITEDWVKEHVHEVYMDDMGALEALRQSVHKTYPAQKLDKITEYEPNEKNSVVMSCAFP